MVRRLIRALVFGALSLATAGAQEIRINCGGSPYTAADGTVWSADQDYSGGDLAYTSSSIGGTSDNALYRAARRGLYGNFGYAIPLANGSYALKLKFAEIENMVRGQRVFNVNVNGAPVLSNFDILSEVPPLTADDKPFTVTVTNGQLKIDVVGVTGFGLLNAIQVVPAPTPTLAASPSSLSFTATAGGPNPSPQSVAVTTSAVWTAATNQPWLSVSPISGTGNVALAASVNSSGLAAGSYTGAVTVTANGATGSPQAIAVNVSVSSQSTPTSSSTSLVNINAGGAAMTGADGTNWSADQYYSGGDLLYTGSSISGTQDQYLYRSARRGLYGDFSYSIPVASGSYTLKLGFAEIAYTAKGQRVFNVNVNGSPVLTNFDILAEVPPLTVDNKTFPVTVSNGVLQVDVVGVVGRGLLNAIQVLPAGSGGTASSPALRTSPSSLSFTATAGGANPAAQGITISNGGGGALSWSASKTQPWLSLSATSGSGAATISVQASVAGLAAGTYSDTVAVSAPGANPSSSSIPVSFTVSSSSQVTGGTSSGGNSGNTDQWQPNSNPPQTYDPSGGPVLYNGIQLPASWPPLNGPSQTYTRPPYIQNPPAVIPIDVGRQLFVDDFLIGSTNLTRVQHQAVMYPGNPVLRPGTGWDTINDAFPYSDGAWYDPADHLFKMWYFGGQAGNEMAYAYSSDGINWVKPSIPDAVVPNTNIVMVIGGGRDTTTVWMDLRDAPSRKFKAFVTYSNGPGGSYVFNIYFSPDGIHWSGPQSVQPAALSDRTTALYNPFRGVWIDSARNGACFPAAPTRAAYCSKRERYYSESRDLQTWTPPDPSRAYWTGTDERDPAYPGTGTIPELYNLDGVAYESILVGLFSWYYPGSPDLVELGVGFSRDGFNWVRPTRGGGPANAFIPSANSPGAWNGYNTQSAGGSLLVVGDQLYFYFSGRNYPHSQDASSTRQTGLATLRRDGFYSMDAGSSPGILTTRPVRFSGSHLFVNVADPSGQLQVEVLDASGNVIPGFARANSATIATDSTHQEVTWGGASVGSLAGQTVEFRFYLTNGALYSFWVSSSSSGASNGYVGADGPGFTGDTDTVGRL